MKQPTQTIARGVLRTAEPQLFVTDMQTCIDYYLKLGFELAFSYGEPSFYSQVRRQGVSLNLRLVDTPFFDEQRRESESLLSASIVCDDTGALFREFECAGAEFHESLKRQPWGAETFILRDPSGNLVLFA
jgi:uncharacterized glyoxalase superfamily protein PhnB